MSEMTEMPRRIVGRLTVAMAQVVRDGGVRSAYDWGAGEDSSDDKLGVAAPNIKESEE